MSHLMKMLRFANILNRYMRRFDYTATTGRELTSSLYFWLTLGIEKKNYIHKTFLNVPGSILAYSRFGYFNPQRNFCGL